MAKLLLIALSGVFALGALGLGVYELATGDDEAPRGAEATTPEEDLPGGSAPAGPDDGDDTTGDDGTGGGADSHLTDTGDGDDTTGDDGTGGGDNTRNDDTTTR